MSIKKLVLLAIFTAIAVVVNILEMYIPIIPGTAFKIGFANIITLIVVFVYSPKEAIIVGLMRIFVAGLLGPSGFGPTFMLSLSGGVFSIIFIVIFSMLDKFSIVGVSVIGSIAHVFGQILAARYLFSDVVTFYAPIMLFLSVPAGIFTGVLANRFLQVSKEWFVEKKY
ncbi:MAG TPA: Gx transporter family protein [Acholeplasma sp.]|nr:Gx transporter family protein [Acholeplasma sp.]